MIYTFSAEEAEKAHDEWGCNCGPAALAFALQTTLDVVRPAIPGFEAKRYTSPTMMKAALAKLGKPYIDVKPCSHATMFAFAPALVRVQWTGPWTQPGANPRWAYGATHWIACWMNQEPWVFDVNGGACGFEAWRTTIAPELAVLHKRADGGWYPTHIWQLAN